MSSELAAHADSSAREEVADDPVPAPAAHVTDNLSAQVELLVALERSRAALEAAVDATVTALTEALALLEQHSAPTEVVVTKGTGEYLKVAIGDNSVGFTSTRGLSGPAIVCTDCGARFRMPTDEERSSAEWYEHALDHLVTLTTPPDAPEGETEA